MLQVLCDATLARETSLKAHNDAFTVLVRLRATRPNSALDARKPSSLGSKVTRPTVAHPSSNKMYQTLLRTPWLRFFDVRLSLRDRRPKTAAKVWESAVGVTSGFETRILCGVRRQTVSEIYFWYRDTSRRLFLGYHS